MSALPELSPFDGVSVLSSFGASGFVGVTSCLTGVHWATAVTSEPSSPTESPEPTLAPLMVQPSNS